MNEIHQRTVVENTFSDYCNITSGVPQGSVLGPTLFLIYVNDLLCSLHQHFYPSISLYAFADDIKLLSENVDELQRALDFIGEWTNDWQLKIQAAKSEHITFYPNKKGVNDTFSLFNINGNAFVKTNLVRDLGLHLSSDLKWAAYISKIQLKSSSTAYIILKTFKSKDPSLYITLFKIYIRPLLEYNCSMWSPYLKKDVERAEHTQKQYTRKVCKRLNIKYQSYSDRLTILNLESLELRRLRYDLTLVYKILHQLIYVNNQGMFELNNMRTNHSLRRHSFYLKIPPVSRTKIRDNFFSTRIINTWNKLPDNIVSSPSLTIFKNLLSKFPLHTIYKFHYT